MRKAHLRFRNGVVVVVDVMQRHQVKPVSRSHRLTPSPLVEWPSTFRYTRPVLAEESVRRLMRPPLQPEAPMRTSESIAEFHIDRASYDPDRDWQNYIEAE